jgi:hypothetical protein
MICIVIDAYEGEHRSNILVYEFEQITKKDGMCVNKVSFSHGPGLVSWIKGVVKQHRS